MTKKQTPWNAGPASKSVNSGVSGAPPADSPATAEPSKFPAGAGVQGIRLSRPAQDRMTVGVAGGANLVNAALVPIMRAKNKDD
jgi:hypothetical protein